MIGAVEEKTDIEQQQCHHPSAKQGQIDDLIKGLLNLGVLGGGFASTLSVS